MLCSNKHCPGEGQGPFIQVLHFLLQQPELSRYRTAVCSLAQTCKAVQKALQQSNTGSISIYTCALKKNTAVATIQAIAAWMTKYPGLVGELHLEHSYEFEDRSSPEAVRTFCHTAEAAMTQAFLQAAGARGSAGSIAAARSGTIAGPAAAAAAASKPPQLSLMSFGCNLYTRPDLLESLPAASLTHLYLGHTADDSEASLNQPRMAAALARLTALRRLDLRERHWLDSRRAVADGADVCVFGKLANACLSTVGSLSRPTQLTIGCVAAGADLKLLPQQLLELQLSAMCSSSSSSSSEGMVVSLGHLIRLQQLDLTVHGTPAAGSSLPLQLQALSVCVAVGAEDEQGHVEHLHITALQQLQRLCLTDALCQANQLQQLTQLPKLQHISLTYGSAIRACSAAPAWRQLSCLHKLYVTDNVTELSREGGQELLAAVGAASSLIKLHLQAGGALLADEDPYDIDVLCAHFIGLQQLRSLELRELNGPQDQLDVLHLTKLTGLTHLSISGACGVDDESATAIAQNLKQLTCLEFPGCCITCGSVLQEFAKLPLLDALDISEQRPMFWDVCLSDEDIQVLLPLPHLKHLQADGTFSEAAMQQFYSS